MEATHTRTIEKTIAFIANNGPEFEHRIVVHKQGSAKFSFVQPSDPYHAYYHHRIAEIELEIGLSLLWGAARRSG